MYFFEQGFFHFSKINKNIEGTNNNTYFCAMEKRKFYILLTVLLPLLLVSCGKGKILDEPTPLPPAPNPPVVTPGENGGGSGTHAWEANRGKIIRPAAGNGWTVTPVEEGIVYYSFSGKEPVTNTNQRIFVTEIDLNNTSFSVKLGYYSGKTTASNVLKQTGAIASINAGYEKAALYLKCNNTVISTISAETIGSTGVPQWKSEAAVYMDQERDVRIEFTGRGMSLAEWRNVYRVRAGTETTFITSAPMLIDDYEPVGERFCALHPLAASGPNCSENPYVHQGSDTNPRTALAKTEDNHLFFIVVDGRREGISKGISAADLTKFLVNNFNPQSAINMDGGGSSTMCVRGQGDPVTFVVNYPCDNRNEDKNGSPKETDGPDHAGERPRDTFFYVVKNQTP